MRRIHFALAGLLMLGCAVAVTAGGAADNAKKLLGTWKLVEGDGPPGSTIQFGPTGKMVMKADINGKALLIEGTYKVDGDKIQSKLTFQGKTKEETMTIKTLTTKSLTVVDEKGKTEKYERAVKTKKTP